MFHGSMVALITPMTEQGNLDEIALEALVDFHLQNGTNAIITMGTTGESATLTHTEHRHVVKQVVRFAAGKIPVIAGTGSNSTQEALELTKSAKEDGADACLLVTPYYNKPTQEGLYQHYKIIAEQVDIPQILYNVPSRTACDLLPATVKRLANLENIIGIKEATGDLHRAKQIMDDCGDQIELYSGDDATAMECILIGAKGDISVTANVAPALMQKMCQAALAGHRLQAEVINEKLLKLHDRLFLEANPIPVKWAMSKMGFGTEGIRLPLTVLSEKYHSSLLSAMQAADIIIE